MGSEVPFNVLFENPTPVGVDFIGIVFHKQGPDGKDVAFVNDYQQNIGETNRKYATVGEQLLNCPPASIPFTSLPGASAKRWSTRET